MSFFRLFCGLFMLVVSVSASAATDTLTNGEQKDFDGDGHYDIRGYSAGSVAIGTTSQSGQISQWGYASSSYASVTQTVAWNASLRESRGSNGFIPSPYEAYIIKTTRGHYYKLQATADSTASGLPLEWALVTTESPTPPTASFSLNTASSIDLIAWFSNTSTGDISSRLWEYNESGNETTSTGNTGYKLFASEGTHEVCLTVSNAGGSDTDCQNITVSKVPSTTYTGGQAIDFDGDGSRDLEPYSYSGRFALARRNGAGTASFGKYADVDLADAQGASYNTSTTGGFAPSLAPDNIWESWTVQTTDGWLVKFWVPENTGSGIRIQHEVLAGSLPDAPDSASFTWSDTDLAVRFTDTSGDDGDTVSSWAWEFNEVGNLQTSTSENPLHQFASAGTHQVCLTASNAGGSAPKLCQNVTVSEVPSTTYSSGQNIDFDGDGQTDLSTFSDCGRIALRVQNATGWAGTGKAYSAVTQADIPGGYSTSDFCTEGYPGSLSDAYLVETSGGDVYKFWTPENTASGIRIQSDVLVDVAPRVMSVFVPANDTYTVGETLSFTVNYTDTVNVTGLPYLTVTIGNQVRQAGYASGTGTNQLVFEYTIVNGDVDDNGIYIGAINLNSGAIRSTGGDDAVNSLTSVGSTSGVLVDAQSPVVDIVLVSSSGSFELGDTLTFQVQFTENLTVTGSDITLGVGMDSGTVQATLSSHVQDLLTFTYEIQNGDSDSDGIQLTVLTKNTTTLTDAAGNDAILTLNNVEDTSGIVVDGIDSDSDGVVDNNDDFPDNIAASTDGDNDGKPDAWNPACDTTCQNNSGLELDPLLDDTDNDGIPNGSDLEPGVDNNPPTVLAPPGFSVISTGALTEVDLLRDGVAYASDVPNVILTPTASTGANTVIELAPGRHVITWSATDGGNNESSDTQTIDVVPLVTFDRETQFAGEGGMATITVTLNGDAPVYPVVIPYQLDGSGTAINPDDHDAPTTGAFTIIEDDPSDEIPANTATVSFNVVDDGTDDTGDTLVFDLVTDNTVEQLDGAELGSPTRLTVTLADINIAPEVALLVSQNGEQVTALRQEDGDVLIEAQVTDANPTDTHSYQWSLNGVTDPLLGSESTLTLPAELLVEGDLQIGVTVMDSGLPVLQTTLTKTFAVTVPVTGPGNPRIQPIGEGGSLPAMGLLLLLSLGLIRRR